MAIWGPGPLDNDDAADWLAGLLDKPKLQRLKSAFGRKTKDLEADDGARAIVAAEVLAQLRGYPGRKPVLKSQQVASLALALDRLSAAEVTSLTDGALSAIERVSSAQGSELRDLLAERKTWLQSWTRALADLKRRLARPRKRVAPAQTSSKATTKTRRVKVALGSIVAIPLGDRGFAFAKVHKDSTYGIYELVRERIVSVEEVLGHPIAFFTSGTVAQIESGAWPVIGQESFLGEDSAWGPPMAAGHSVGLISAGHIPVDGEPFAAAIIERGTFRPCTLDEVIGLDIGDYASEPELIVDVLVDRLIHGKHERYRVFDFRKAARRVT